MGTIDSWSSIETIIKQRLDFYEIDRRNCVICGRQGPSLSRCFACQMVYYCGEEHQAEDWSKAHAQRCALLEWVALGEFIQALPAQPPLPELGDKWILSLKEINNWKNWFSIRTNIVQLANNTANIIQNLAHVSDKRQPTYENAVDGLLAAVTDLLTHVLTIGKAIMNFGLQPNLYSLVIRILSGFNKIDLDGNNQSSITSTLPARFHELLNMFPDNKGVELVIVIGDDEQNDTDHSSLPHAKLKPDRLIITTTGKGRCLDTSEDERLQQTKADLLVYFNAAHLFSPSNKEQLKTMLTRQRPTLLTFDDEEEFNQAKACLSTKKIPIHQAGTNQFSSMIIRQRSNRPNSTYSTNSYQILLNAMTINGSAERNAQNYSLLSRQHSHQSSNGIQQQQQQQQINPGLKQVNGKIHIESLSSSSSTSSSPPSSTSHNTRANNNGTPLDTNVHIVSTTNTTTVQPLGRSNNINIHQPAIVQRRHHSPSTTPAPSSAITSTTNRETQMITGIEPIRNYIRPQPKPRLSLVKPTSKETEPLPIQLQSTNDSIVQRIKPFFEQRSSPPVQEAKPFKQQQQQQQQQRQPISIPYSYDIGRAFKVTCLDDVISSNRQQTESPSPPPIPPLPPVETSADSRTITPATVRFLPASIDERSDQHLSEKNSTPSPPVQNSRSITEPNNHERPIKSPVNSVSSPLIIPIEIHHDQRHRMSTNAITSPPPRSSSYNENRFDERSIPVAANKTTSTSPPPRPPLPTSMTHNEVIYTEVIKNHEKSLPLHRIDLTKAPLSPSRSFIMPTKSPSISSKNSSFNHQRPSRPAATATNYSYHVTKSKTIPSMMSADRISLYSQRSNKQADVGVTIKNLSECIDRVGIVFDDSNRPNNTPSTGLTTADLIREQLSASSNSKSTGSLLDKLHKSNSSTRLPTSASRTPINLAAPRSKSQQATRTSIEQSTTLKTNPTTSTIATQSVRRTVGVFLPITPKNTRETEQPTSNKFEQPSTLLYQNIEPHVSIIATTTNSSSPPTTHLPDYTLKQHVGPVCNGVPKPFRKPTAIIEPSPVVTTPITKPSEPNYINLTHQDEHIYTNENGLGLQNTSNSNSYTSKTSSIYSSSDKQNPSSNPEIVYAVANIPTSFQHEQSVEYDSFDDELVADNAEAKVEKPYQNPDNTDDDSFDDDEQQLPVPSIPSKNSSTNFFRSTLNRLTRSNKSLDRLNTDMPTTNDFHQESNLANVTDTKTEKKTLRSIKARREAKKTGNLFPNYADDDTTSIDSNCSTQTATSLNKHSKSSSHQRFRLFRRKIEKEFASDTEAEKHQTEQRRKKFNKKLLDQTANELKNKRLLMMSDDDDDDDEMIRANLNHDEPHIYDHIVHDELPINQNSSRMGKLSHETHLKSPTVTLDEIRSEIQAEIAARQDHIQVNNQPMNSSNLTLQKKRSKSVTFLDELLSDDTKPKPANLNTKNDTQLKPSTTAKRIEKGDARSICGALTGTGPIRGIIKAANNDITGTTAPISPSVAATIYLSGTSMETKCTSPKVAERTHRPLSTYTVGSARFYDGAAVSSTSAPPPPPPPVPSSSSSNQPSHSSNHRPILTNPTSYSTSDNPHHKRPTAKVSPFQTKSSNDSSSSPKQQPAAFSSTSKKPLRSSIHRNMQMSHDIPNIATPSLSDGVGGVSKRLQSNF